MWTKFRIPILALLLVGLSLSISAQSITGTVTGDDGEPLIGVNVTVKDTSTGTITDFNGAYEIACNSDDILHFSYIGYTDQDVAVDGRTVVDVVMSEGVALNEVVVTALGITRDKKALGYAAVDVGSDQILEARQSQVITAIQGKVPGVSISQTSGAPGAGADIVIRGITSLDPSRSNSPLVVIDGVPVSNSTDVASMLPKENSSSTSAGQSSFSNRLMDINPADVENISILKGASATALYGIRAANGVILITTKKGKSGKAQITYNASFGKDYLGKRPDYQFKYGMGRSGRLLTFQKPKYEFWYTLGPPVKDGVTEVHDPVADFFRTGMRLENSIGVSGGNDKVTYFTSFSQRKQDGIVPGSDWGRLTGRFGGDIQANDRLKISGTINFVNSGGKRPHEGDKSVLSSLAYYTTGTDINDYINDDGTMRDLTNGIIDNPRYLAEFTTFQDNVNRTYGNIGFNYKLSSKLSLDYKFGIDHYSDFRERIVASGFDISSKQNGFIIEETVNSNEFNSLLMLKYNTQLTDDIGFNFVLGNDLLSSKKNIINTRGEDFSSNYKSLNNAKNIFTSVRGSRKRIVGLFGLASFSFKDYLYLDITGRNDNTSTLPVNNRSYFYPSASMSWVVSDMTDLPDVVSFAKIRASYSKVGKDALPHRIGQYYSKGSNFPFDGYIGFGPSSVKGDKDLRPEFTTGLEFGTDIRFFRNRLGVDFTWYQSTSEDMITSIPISNTTGLSRYITNAGSIQNKGIEILVNTTPVQRKNFSWDFDMNFAKSSGEVLSLADGIESIEYYNGSVGYHNIVSKLVKGGHVGDLWGQRYARTPDGDLLIKNGFPYREDTLSVVGNALPDFVMAFTNRFTFKGFSLSGLFEWKKGGDKVDQGFRNSARNGLLDETSLRYAQVVFKGKVNTGTDDAPVYEDNTEPVEIYGGNYYRNSDRFNRSADILVQDASWFRLRNVTLSYSLPSSTLAKINGIEKARISLTGTNIYLNTPFRGYDPETNFFGSGSNIRGYTGLKTPGTRSYTLSLDLTF